MAGKSNKGRNRRGAHNTTNSSESVVSSDAPPKDNLSDLHLYPVSVKTQSGEKLELQLNPGDSVMDIRQFLLDAPETCLFVGSNMEIILAALYDDRSIRAHVHRTRELLSLSTLHASLSTSLALQYETTQNKASSPGDTAKIEVPELDGLGFMEDVAGSLSNLLSSSSKEIKCVESIVFSSFNPPPSYRRLVGDLIYLDVVTLEGNKFCITGTTKMFYVNSSTGTGIPLDPRPSKTSSEATTLVGLLQKISSKFKKAFREILERRASAHPFENVQSLLPPNSWLGLHPVPEHKRDAARAEDALTLSYGSELIGMQRDWNEELQSCREFPHTTPQELPRYVHNNIFFSFAVDADLEQLSKKRSANSNIESSSSLNISSDKASSLLHGDSGIPNGEKCEGSSSGERDTVVEVASNVPAETQLTESEQATYASANNDLKGTKAYQEADVSGLYNLAMAIIDYRGHRVVAQSVLPGILQGDKSDSLLYGSVDNGKKICWNEDFHSKVLEAAKRLHLKEHTVLDGSGNVFKLAAPVECKGIVGSDDRHYLLDLMRVTPRDANYTGPGSRFCILRPELITAFCQAQAAERSKCKSEGDAHVTTDSSTVVGVDEQVRMVANATAAFDCLIVVFLLGLNCILEGKKKTLAAAVIVGNITKEGRDENVKDCASSQAETEPREEILFNPNVFTEFKLSGNQEASLDLEIVEDEENVRKVSSYLTNVVLPKFVQDLCTLEVSPMDGQTLTEALHAHGINVRYIGKVADGTKHLPHLWDLCSNEIVVRSAKHILKDVLRDIEDHDIAGAISHFFNCFFGTFQAVGTKVTANNMQSRTHRKDQGGHQSSGKPSRGQGRWKGGASARKNQSSFMNVSSETLWSDIQEFAKLKYQIELPEDARSRVKKVSVIRNLCQKVGISVAARKYDLNSAAPFQTSDILNLQPVVKHSVPLCSEAKDLVETGKIQLAEGMLSEAYTLFSEAFSILQQVTGPMHREVANCCRYLAMVLYHAGDMAGAIMQQHKELIINERYGNMALFYHGLNQTELALRHMSRALLLLSLSSGPDHPDVAATFINVAMMYQDIGKMNTALRYLQEALKKNERLLGEEHIQTAVCYHALAIAFNCMGAFKLSHQHEKKTYDILVKQLGEEDSRTRDSQNWMKTFKMRELQMNAQKQKGQALNAASAQKAIDILKAHPDLIHAFQAAAAAGGSGSSGTSVNKSLNAAVIGENLPRGRGVDERAARAAAEVRKKAAARGLLIRPHGVPVQALPPLTQLLNIINSGMTPDAAEGGETDGVKTEANGHPSDGPLDSKDDQLTSGQEDQAPVGLGTGLASLDAKKQKAKAKVAA
uniref:Clu domain-containing protein n=1 Tax=Fagus sylvatica TaxID=28930 RepID=A0A2N9FHE4_FAGSY